jgi:RNA polymerase sigma-70 factor (ECF subfamily)
VKSWLFTLTHNAIKDSLKTQAKNTSLNEETLSLEMEPDDEHSAKDCIIPLVKNLPPTYKEAVFLSEIKGMKQAEVAKRLNISLSGAKSRIQRGRHLLKQGFIECCDYKLNELGHLVGEHKDKKDCKICNAAV